MDCLLIPIRMDGKRCLKTSSLLHSHENYVVLKTGKCGLKAELP